MKIIIDIPEARYKDIRRIASVQLENYHFKTAEQIIANGTPLPKGHGDLIDRKDLIENGISKGFCDWYDEIKMADTIIKADKVESEDKLDGDPVDIDKAVEHYEGTMGVLKGIDLEVDDE